MSYTSRNVLSTTAKLAHVLEIVALLGYKKLENNVGVANHVGNYFWFEYTDYKSWTGIELQVYRKNGQIAIDTRSRVSRSYWDLLHQNKTISLLKGIFGGSFDTDAGTNRFWHPDAPPPTPLSSGCYLARWRFKNALQRANIYLDARELKGDISNNKLTGLTFVDDINPRLLSNNMILPFAMGVWEDYFRSTYVALLATSQNRNSAFKKTRLSDAQIDQIANQQLTVVEAVVENMSFQRPSKIAEHFKTLDSKLDFAGILKKPYRRRKISLFEKIEELVEIRNNFVHAGEMNHKLLDKQLEQVLSDLTAAVDRFYVLLGKHHDFKPIRDY